MNRYEFGVILATVLLFTAITVIRAIVVPIVRRRASSFRRELTVPSQVEEGGRPPTEVHALSHQDGEFRFAHPTARADPLNRVSAGKLNQNLHKGGHS